MRCNFNRTVKRRWELSQIYISFHQGGQTLWTVWLAQFRDGEPPAQQPSSRWRARDPPRSDPRRAVLSLPSFPPHPPQVTAYNKLKFQAIVSNFWLGLLKGPTHLLKIRWQAAMFCSSQKFSVMWKTFVPSAEIMSLFLLDDLRDADEKLADWGFARWKFSALGSGTGTLEKVV